VLVDGNGIPLSLVVSGAERHDVKLLEPTLDHILVKRPRGREACREHLCADKGYSGKPAREAIRARNYIPHVRQIGEEVGPPRSTAKGTGRADGWLKGRIHG
jgi:putative transposase